MQIYNSISIRWTQQPKIYPWLAGTSLTLLLWTLFLRGQFHLIAAIIIGGTFVLISIRDRGTAAVLTMAYLLLMGDLRRIIGLTGQQPGYDPLLLVGPVVAMCLALPVLIRLPLHDLLSKIMFGILCIMVLEIANPRQGGLGVGLSGAFFYVVPMFWFWAGRNVASPRTIERLLYHVYLPFGIIASILGLCQTFIGVLPYQKAWVESVTHTYSSLYVGGSIRPFGFSVSAAEYSGLLMVAFLLSTSAFFTRQRAWCIFIPLIGTAVLLASGRGVIIRSLISIAVLFVVRKRRPIKPSNAITIVVVAALLLFGMSQIASRFAPSDEKVPAQKNTAAQDSLAHQFGGLAHPFDKKYSTAGLHANMALDGFLSGFRYPLGSGLGYSTFAAEKLNGGAYDLQGQGSSEIDLSDMFIDLGFIGGFLYILAVGLILYQALRYIRAVPLHISLPLFAILLATAGGWLIAGQYSTSTFFFFVIGSFTQPIAPYHEVQEEITLEALASPA